MRRRHWNIQLDGQRHTVELSHALMSGTRQVLLDGKPVVDHTDPCDKGAEYEFTLGTHDLKLIIEQDLFVYRYYLEVDGEPVGVGVGEDRPRPRDEAAYRRARLLSLLFPGLGHLSYRDFNRGLGWLAIGAVALVVTLFTLLEADLSVLHPNLEGKTQWWVATLLAPPGLLAFNSFGAAAALAAPLFAWWNVAQPEKAARADDRLQFPDDDREELSPLILSLSWIGRASLACFLISACVSWVAGLLVAHFASITVVTRGARRLGDWRFVCAFVLWNAATLTSFLHYDLRGGFGLGGNHVEVSVDDIDALDDAAVARFTDGRLLPRRDWGLHHFKSQLFSENARWVDDPLYTHHHRAVPIVGDDWEPGDPVLAWMVIQTIWNDNESDTDLKEVLRRWDENKAGYRLGSIFTWRYRKAVEAAIEKGITSRIDAPLFHFSEDPAGDLRWRALLSVLYVGFPILVWIGAVLIARRNARLESQSAAAVQQT